MAPSQSIWNILAIPFFHHGSFFYHQYVPWFVLPEKSMNLQSSEVYRQEIPELCPCFSFSVMTYPPSASRPIKKRPRHLPGIDYRPHRSPHKVSWARLLNILFSWCLWFGVLHWYLCINIAMQTGGVKHFHGDILIAIKICGIVNSWNPNAKTITQLLE